MKTTTFMTGHWTDLIMRSYTIEPDVLVPFLPNDVELDLFNNKAVFSAVAFQFSKVKFFGIKVPFHQNFGEINFRVYVKSKIDRRKGVVFLREFAPKPLIAFIANKIYNEPFYYKSIQMRKEHNSDSINTQYNFPGGILAVNASQEFMEPETKSFDHFIIDRYVAFVKNEDLSSKVYLIQHKPWAFSKNIEVSEYGAVLDLLPPVFKRAKLLHTHFVNGSEVGVEFGFQQQDFIKSPVIS